MSVSEHVHCVCRRSSQATLLQHDIGHSIYDGCWHLHESAHTKRSVKVHSGDRAIMDLLLCITVQHIGPLIGQLLHPDPACLQSRTTSTNAHASCNYLGVACNDATAVLASCYLACCHAGVLDCLQHTCVFRLRQGNRCANRRVAVESQILEHRKQSMYRTAVEYYNRIGTSRDTTHVPVVGSLCT
jgi:hypothetical protein